MTPTRSGRPRHSARQRDWLFSRATGALIRALAGLESRTDDGLALALLEAGIALHRIAEIDVDDRAKDRVIAFLERRSEGGTA